MGDDPPRALLVIGALGLAFLAAGALVGGQPGALLLSAGLLVMTMAAGVFFLALLGWWGDKG